MDVQSIDEIIKAFHSLGGDAKEAFIWYLMIVHFPKYVIGLIWTVIFIWAAREGLFFIRAMTPSEKLLRSFGGSRVWRDEDLDSACKILSDAKRKN